MIFGTQVGAITNHGFQFLVLPNKMTNNCFVEVSKLNYDPKTVLCVKALFMDSFFKNAQETVGDFR
jgi:hypothetical protein